MTTVQNRFRFRVLCGVWVTMFLVTLASVASAAAPRIGFASAKSGLSIRGQANTTSPRLGLAPLGAQVQILRMDGPEATFENNTSHWYKVRWEKIEGWAFGGFIRVEPTKEYTGSGAASSEASAESPTIPRTPTGDDSAAEPLAVPPALVGDTHRLFAGTRDAVHLVDFKSGKTRCLATFKHDGKGTAGVESMVFDAEKNTLYVANGLDVWSIDVAAGKAGKLATAIDADNTRLRDLAFVDSKRATLVATAFGWDGASVADNCRTYVIDVAAGKASVREKAGDHETARRDNRNGLTQKAVAGFTEVFVTGADGKERQVTRIAKLGLAKPEGSDAVVELLYAFRLGTDRLIVSPVEEWGDYAHGSIYCYDLEGSGAGKPLLDPAGKRVHSSSFNDSLFDVSGDGRWVAYRGDDGTVCVTDFGKHNASLGGEVSSALFAE